MQRTLDAGRKQRMLLSYSYMKPIFLDIARRLPTGAVLLDVGTGEGVISFEIVKDLKVAHAHFVDIENILSVALPKHVSLLRRYCTSEPLARRP